MSEDQFAALEGFNRPLIFRVGWPEPIGISEGAIRAVLFESVANKESLIDATIVNKEEKFLEIVAISGAVRLTSGKYTGSKSRISSRIVRIDGLGRPTPPKRGIRGFLGGRKAQLICSWQEGLAVALHFADLGPMPPDLAWWHDGGE